MSPIELSSSSISPPQSSMPRNSPQLGAVPGSAALPIAEIPREQVATSTSSSSLPSDVAKFMDTFDLRMANILLFSDDELRRLVKSFEPDDSAFILLFNRLTVLRQENRTSSSSNSNAPVSTKFGNFGQVTFPDIRTGHRDVNKWPHVLGRTFQGISDSISVSKFCTLLVSYGIKESTNCIEFFRFVLYNLTPEVNVEVGTTECFVRFP
jgi:hypothetical protein